MAQIKEHASDLICRHCSNNESLMMAWSSNSLETYQNGFDRRELWMVLVKEFQFNAISKA